MRNSASSISSRSGRFNTMENPETRSPSAFSKVMDRAAGRSPLVFFCSYPRYRGA